MRLDEGLGSFGFGLVPPPFDASVLGSSFGLPLCGSLKKLPAFLSASENLRASAGCFRASARILGFCFRAVL